MLDWHEDGGMTSGGTACEGRDLAEEQLLKSAHATTFRQAYEAFFASERVAGQPAPGAAIVDEERSTNEPDRGSPSSANRCS